jgi:hypothetical protein
VNVEKFFVTAHIKPIVNVDIPNFPSLVANPMIHPGL